MDKEYWKQLQGKWPDLSKVEKALAVYDERADDLDFLVDWKEYLRFEEEAIRQVHLAFYEATKDRNSWDHVKVVPISAIREMVKEWKEDARR